VKFLMGRGPRFVAVCDRGGVTFVKSSYFSAYWCGPRLHDYVLCGPRGQKGWTSLL